MGAATPTPQPSGAQQVADAAATASEHDATATNTGAEGEVNQDRVEARAPVAQIFEGTYRVGTDVLPGRYETTGPRAAEYPCEWARLGPGAVGAQPVLGSGTPSGTFTVTITASDTSFRTGNCGLWHQV